MEGSPGFSVIPRGGRPSTQEEGGRAFLSLWSSALSPKRDVEAWPWRGMVTLTWAVEGVARGVFFGEGVGLVAAPGCKMVSGESRNERWVSIDGNVFFFFFEVTLFFLSLSLSLAP